MLRLALFALLAASPFVMVRALAGGSGVAAAAGLAGLQGYLLVRMLPVRRSRPWALACGVALAALVLRFPQAVLAIWPGIPHAAIYLILLAIFAMSLRPPREPIVCGFARRLRGPLPPELLAYTRRVTILWTAFFAAEIATSALLLACAPRAAWIWFVTVLNLPLLAAVFMAEYGYRRWRWRHSQPETLGDMARLFMIVRAGFFRPEPRS